MSNNYRQDWSKFKTGEDGLNYIYQAINETVSNNPETANPTHYNGTSGYETLEAFPNCGNHKVHIYVILAIKYLLRLGKKDDIRVELKKAITYLARAYYCVDPSNFNPEDISESFKDWS